MPAETRTTSAEIAAPATPGRVAPEREPAPATPAPATAHLTPDAPGRAAAGPADLELDDAPVGTTETTSATTDAGVWTAPPRVPADADHAPRPPWLPKADRLSVIRADDRDRNLGLVANDAGTR